MVEQIGKYKVSELIGHGGMADVYKVVNEGVSGFSKTLCIKRIRKRFVDRVEFVEMFETEARIVSHLQHDNIVQVYDFGRDENTRELFLVMEYIDGLDLNTILNLVEDYGTVSIHFAVYVLESLLLALDHAHNLVIDGKNSCVIHRDISPHNLLISSSGSVKLADFGIAKAKGLSATDETRTGVLKGKLSYMSPEQGSAGKMPITPASDLFSAGVVFWETIMCKQLFNATMEHLALGAMKYDEASLSHLSERVRTFAAGLLAPDPVNRFSSAEATLKALHRIGIRPCSKSDAARLVRKCKGDIEKDTWVAAHKFDTKDKRTPREKMLTQPTNRTEMQPDRSQTPPGENTAAEDNTGTHYENSSTAVEMPNLSDERRWLRHPTTLIAGIAMGIFVTLLVLWFALRFDSSGAASLVTPGGEKTAAPLESESSSKSETEALSAPTRQEAARPTGSVFPDDTKEEDDDDDDHAVKSVAADEPKGLRNGPAESASDTASKVDTPTQQETSNTIPSSPQNDRTRHKKSLKKENAKGELKTLANEQFPLEKSPHKGN